jgi:hypothetical protein
MKAAESVELKLSLYNTVGNWVFFNVYANDDDDDA